MWNSFRLTLVKPAVIQRIGKLQAALQIAQKIEDEVHFQDGTYLEMRIQETTDSSYMRMNNFRFPIQILISRMKGGDPNKTRVSSLHMAFWKSEDGRCLVMLDSTNKPEDNIDCTQEEALEHIKERIETRL